MRRKEGRKDKILKLVGQFAEILKHNWCHYKIFLIIVSQI